MSEPLGTIRASSWPTLFDCSLRWYYGNVMKMRLPANGKARLGTALHQLRRNRAAGARNQLAKLGKRFFRVQTWPIRECRARCGAMGHSYSSGGFFLAFL